MDLDKIFSRKISKEYDESDINTQNEPSQSLSALQYIQGMYEEFKKSLELKNYQRIDLVIKNITNVDPNSNYLNSILGQLSLLKGQGLDSYRYLFNFSRNSTSVDLPALGAMGLWNNFVGEYSIALTQFSKVIQGNFSKKFLIFILFNAAKAKKRLGFYDRAMDYLVRSLVDPEGYRMILMIKLETIHILILRLELEQAQDEIDEYMQYSNNIFLKRLRIFLSYSQKNFKDVARFNNEEDSDPYISYLLARCSIENPKALNLDAVYLLEEAIRATPDNKYIYNTLGNYYCSTERYSEAIEQYNIALSIDPGFDMVLNNLRSVNTINTHNERNHKILAEINPDVELMGFFNTWKLYGYSSFKIDQRILKKIPSLKYYL